MKSFRLLARRLSIVAAATLAGTAAVVALSATPAFATFPTISGEATCNTVTGNWDVAWTVTNTFVPTATVKTVGHTPDTTELTGGIVVGATIDHNASLAGEQHVPAGSATEATVTVMVRFTEHVEATRTGIVEFEGGCGKATVDVTTRSACDEMFVHVQNTGDVKADGSVVNGADIEQFHLAPGAGADFHFGVQLPGGPAGGVTVVVTLTGQQPQTFEWKNPGNCETPPPTTTPPPLPVTGASLTGLIGVAVALVVVGAALLFVLRRRRTVGES